jgi:hypothetical protein
VRTGAVAVACFAFAAGIAGAAELTLEGQGAYLELAGARRSAEALFGGTSGGPLVSAGVRAGLSPHVFVRVNASYFSRKGERVFVADETSPVFRLGHPLTLRLTPLYADVGFQTKGETFLRPYVGLGAGAVRVYEESTVGGDTTSASRTRPSARLFAGALLGHGAVRFGAELAYARTPDAIGLGGVSKVYGETDLGGPSLAATLLFRP